MPNWQLPNAPDGENFPLIVAAMQRERLMRYLPASGGDERLALRFYLWNCALCEAFHLSTHYAEIVCRNTLSRVLVAKLGERWFDNQTFYRLLDPHFQGDLNAAIQKEAESHGANMTSHHIVSALHFGFWDHLATKRFNRLIWANGAAGVFRHCGLMTKREDIHGKIESVRRWRNRIAHHSAIFDKGPSRKHADALELIRWSCPVTAAWVASQSRVPMILSLRPA